MLHGNDSLIVWVTHSLRSFRWSRAFSLSSFWLCSPSFSGADTPAKSVASGGHFATLLQARKDGLMDTPTEKWSIDNADTVAGTNKDGSLFFPKLPVVGHLIGQISSCTAEDRGSFYFKKYCFSFLSPRTTNPPLSIVFFKKRSTILNRERSFLNYKNEKPRRVRRGQFQVIIL